MQLNVNREYLAAVDALERAEAALVAAQEKATETARRRSPVAGSLEEAADRKMMLRLASQSLGALARVKKARIVEAELRMKLVTDGPGRRRRGRRKVLTADWTHFRLMGRVSNG
jgi:hypothetical protein